MNSESSSQKKLSAELSPINVWALAFGCIIGWGAFVMPGNTFLPKAGPAGTAISMLIASIVMSIVAINYDYMIRMYPTSGGEFIYTDKTFGRTNAYICSWFLGLSYLAIVPLNATALALIGRNLLHNIFQFGFHYSVAGYDVYLGEILLACGALVLFALCSMRGVKFSGIFQTILVFALILGVTIITIAALSHKEVSFTSLAPAFNLKFGKLAGCLAVIAIAPWAFVGFDTVPQAAEEFNFSPKKSRSIMIFSIIWGGLVYVIVNTVTAMAYPKEYSSWFEYIQAVPKLEGLKSLPTFNAAYQLCGKAGLFFMGIAVLAAVLTGIIGFYMATSRLLYSMAQEKVLPTWFGELHPRYKTPSKAILFILLLSLVAPFFGRTALGWVVDMSSLGAAIGYGYTSAAAMKTALQNKNFPVTITGAVGLLFSLAFVVLLLVPIPLFNCSLGKEPYICLLFWILLGIIFYCFSLKNRKDEAKTTQE